MSDPVTGADASASVDVASLLAVAATGVPASPTAASAAPDAAATGTGTAEPPHAAAPAVDANDLLAIAAAGHSPTAAATATATVPVVESAPVVAASVAVDIAPVVAASVDAAPATAVVAAPVEAAPAPAAVVTPAVAVEAAPAPVAVVDATPAAAAPAPAAAVVTPASVVVTIAPESTPATQPQPQQPQQPEPQPQQPVVTPVAAAVPVAEASTPVATTSAVAVTIAPVPAALTTPESPASAPATTSPVSEVKHADPSPAAGAGTAPVPKKRHRKTEAALSFLESISIYTIPLKNEQSISKFGGCVTILSVLAMIAVTIVLIIGYQNQPKTRTLEEVPNKQTDKWMVNVNAPSYGGANAALRWGVFWSSTCGDTADRFTIVGDNAGADLPICGKYGFTIIRSTPTGVFFQETSNDVLTVGDSGNPSIPSGYSDGYPNTVYVNGNPVMEDWMNYATAYENGPSTGGGDGPQVGNYGDAAISLMFVVNPEATDPLKIVEDIFPGYSPTTSRSVVLKIPTDMATLCAVQGVMCPQSFKDDPVFKFPTMRVQAYLRPSPLRMEAQSKVSLTPAVLLSEIGGLLSLVWTGGLAVVACHQLWKSCRAAGKSAAEQAEIELKARTASTVAETAKNAPGQTAADTTRSTSASSAKALADTTRVVAGNFLSKIDAYSPDVIDPLSRNKFGGILTGLTPIVVILVIVFLIYQWSTTIILVQQKVQIPLLSDEWYNFGVPATLTAPPLTAFTNDSYFIAVIDNDGCYAQQPEAEKSKWTLVDGYFDSKVGAYRQLVPGQDTAFTLCGSGFFVLASLQPESDPPKFCDTSVGYYIGSSTYTPRDTIKLNGQYVDNTNQGVHITVYESLNGRREVSNTYFVSNLITGAAYTDVGTGLGKALCTADSYGYTPSYVSQIPSFGLGIGGGTEYTLIRETKQTSVVALLSSFGGAISAVMSAFTLLATIYIKVVGPRKEEDARSPSQSNASPIAATPKP